MAETRLFSLHPFRHGPGIIAEGGEYFESVWGGIELKNGEKWFQPPPKKTPQKRHIDALSNCRDRNLITPLLPRSPLYSSGCEVVSA